MITEVELLERMNEILLTTDEDIFLEMCNRCLNTEYTFDDVVWRADIDE
jgi:hypothetical protein